MIFITLIIASAVLANIGLGITVFLTNKARKTNQAYLSITTFAFLWLLANIFTLHSKTSAQAIISINTACAISACIPSSFQLLRLVIKYPNKSWYTLLKLNAIQLISNAIVFVICFLPSFTISVQFPEAGTTSGLVQPEYGKPFIFLVLYFIGSTYVLAYNLFWDRKLLQGAQRLELEFLVFAGLSGLSVGVLGLIYSFLSKSSDAVPITNAASIVTISLIVAYGIATKHILDVGTVIRKIIAYALLTSYLVIVYLGIWGFAKYILFKFAPNGDFLAQVTAAVVMAFSMAPVHGRFQKVADKLVTSHAMDIPETMKKAGNIFQSVSTFDALQLQFSSLLKESLRSDDVRILSANHTGYVQKYPKKKVNRNIILSLDSAIAEIIQKTKEPLGRDSLVRARETQLTKRSIKELKDLEINVVVGIFLKTELNGMVIFGSRRGGRIYDKNEQDALQILCNQFAVALENAHLYTEMQDSKIRNEIMLDQLVSGVIVASPDRKISLINNEAQRITGLTEEQAIGQDIGMLPETVSQAMETTLTTTSSLRNIDTVLFAQEEKSTHVRMGSAYLIGHDDKPMGALLVFTDMTEMKSLEEQVRRSDQLSSVGTLAAGMAHEIKNPLVTIKTFTQLLPERHDDPDFRKDFSTLVAHEVARIDGIVNQLLSFSKPSQPHLVPMKLHDTVAQTLKLIHEQLSQKNIELKKDFRAKQDFISGDADLLTQTLVNLNLNAIDAIESDGVIKVSTTNCTYRFANGDDPERASTLSCIRLQISDTGKGIPQDQLQKIFDPFFTSKSEGTGMGLSVAHGIIQEHHGAIEVQSEQSKGTSFSIYIPLLIRETVAA